MSLSDLERLEKALPSVETDIKEHESTAENELSLSLQIQNWFFNGIGVGIGIIVGIISLPFMIPYIIFVGFNDGIHSFKLFLYRHNFFRKDPIPSLDSGHVVLKAKPSQAPKDNLKNMSSLTNYLYVSYTLMDKSFNLPYKTYQSLNDGEASSSLPKNCFCVSLSFLEFKLSINQRLQVKARSRMPFISTDSIYSVMNTTKDLLNVFNPAHRLSFLWKEPAIPSTARPSSPQILETLRINTDLEISLKDYVPTLYPLDIQPVQFFKKNLPIVLVYKPLKVDPGTTTSPKLENAIDGQDSTPQSPVVNENLFLYFHDPQLKEKWWIKLTQSSALARVSDGNDLITLEQKAESMASFHSLYLDVMCKTIKNSTEEELPLWNALISRIFLVLRHQEEFNEFINEKVSSKLMNFSKPSFLSDIQLRSIDLGTDPPRIKDAHLALLDNEGHLDVRMHLTMSGLSMEVGVTLSLEVTTISVVLIIKILKLQGVVTIQMHDPSSDRLWFAFVSEPEIDLHINTNIVTGNQSQFKVGFVTQLISDKIKESIKDTIVLPYLEDIHIPYCRPSRSDKEMFTYKD